MNTATQALESLTALDSAPLLFAGSDSFCADEPRLTVTGRTGDPDWACRILGAVEPGERALLSAAFADDGPAVAHLVTPQPVGPLGRGPALRRVHDVTDATTDDEYAATVRSALTQIDRGRLEKVVLGRYLDVRSDPPLDPAEVVADLLHGRPGRYVFSVPLQADLRGPRLIGASPELLIRRRGPQVASTPLAGSAPRSTDPAEDARRADALLASAKDLAEHAFVVDHIVAALAPLCDRIDAPPTPELIATDAMWHLASPITGRLAAPADATVVDLARLLHPTPALGGVPVAESVRLIDQLEGPGRRGPFGGFVGWTDEHGDGELAIAIRAGVLDGPFLRLFAGAGIVAGSIPQAEADETAAKLRTMTRAVGL